MMMHYVSLTNYYFSQSVTHKHTPNKMNRILLTFVVWSVVFFGAPLVFTFSGEGHMEFISDNYVRTVQSEYSESHQRTLDRGMSFLSLMTDFTFGM